jgi:hypothetical protein
MIMIASIKSSPANSVAAHPKRNRWNSEFERIHIFAAAKIRGESVGARRLDDGSFNGGSSNRSAHEELVRWRRSRLEAQVDGRTSTVASQSPRPHASVGKRRRAVVGARVIVACLGPYLFNIADGWTETRIAETQYLQASSGITCHRRLAPTASNHHGLPGYIDNKSNVRVWKTITLGTYDSVASLRDAVRCHTGQLAGKALRHPGFRVSGKKV